MPLVPKIKFMMCLYDTLTSCQDDFPVLPVVTALKYAEIFRLCFTILNYYLSWILCNRDFYWFLLMLLIRVEYFCQNNLKPMNIWFVNVLPILKALFVPNCFYIYSFLYEWSGWIWIRLSDFNVTYPWVSVLLRKLCSHWFYPPTTSSEILSWLYIKLSPLERLTSDASHFRH